MIPGDNVKYAQIIMPQSVASTATATGYVDTLGFEQAVILWSIDKPSTNPGVWHLSEGDTTSSYATISGFVGDTDWTVPAADTDNAQNVAWVVDLKHRKRYLKATITPGATTVMAANVHLLRAKEAPTTDTLMGCTEVVRG